MSSRKLALLPDVPIGNSLDDKDELGFDIYAHVLSDAIKNSSGPMTIGVYGEWGEGKTSLMQLIKRSLDVDSSNISTVWFNAWRYAKEEHPVFSLAISIIKALEKNQKLSEKSKAVIASIIDTLSSIASGFKVNLTAKTDLIGEINVEYDADKTLNRSFNKDTVEKSFTSKYFDMFDQLEDLKVGSSGEKIVVFIDDLDRCMPQHAISLLESIKLTFGLNGFVFVLGVARDILDDYVERVYKDEYGVKKFDGASYLDKIIQLSFFIPPHAPRFSDYLRMLLTRINLTPGAGFKDLLPLVEIACNNNPRSAIGFINNLLVDKEILKSLRGKDKAVLDVDIGVFAVLRAIQKSWGHLLSAFILLGEDCKNIQDWVDSDIDTQSKLEATNVKEQQLVTIAQALKNDISLKKLLRTDYGKKWLMDNNERQFSIHFLNRQRGEISKSISESEKEIKVYVSIYNKIDASVVESILSSLHEAGVTPVLTEKIGKSQNWNEAIKSNLHQCGTFLCFIGNSKAQSNNSKLELKILADLPVDHVIKKCVVFLPEFSKKSEKELVGFGGDFKEARLSKRQIDDHDYREVMRAILN